MTSTTRPRIEARQATTAEADTVVAACLEAFADEAVFTWVLPDPEQRRLRADEFFDVPLRAAIDAGNVLVAVTDDGHVAGASVWLDSNGGDAEPSQTQPPAEDDPVANRLVLVAEATAAAHPRTSHLFLSSMAALPAYRGHGVGTAMLTVALHRADRQARPVYLEASTPRSRDLYARFGFRDHGPAIHLPYDGPTLQPMYRPATRD
ncbi:acetyltransferase (GNAT) family protein [Haloactinopolyspora alba]|uniref:Acetyltransferase (GNAT) family protein n=1 Tax=Haloactinopolyspora alba TaxID=648780 RepID=A0A2P8EBH5_9ACTN|nr:GNAT family N-acetyltransferase [Haloactinopolyspora alba]PSL06829.1 acetyltransferase (GNAT) family protein [Haloactinopolyspora alba]